VSAPPRYRRRPRAPARPGESGAVPQRLAIAAVALVYVFVLHTVYQHVIAPEFSYLQYTYRSPDPVHYSIAIAMVVALAVILPHRISQPSQFICWILFVVAVAPSILVPQYTQVLDSADAIEVAAWAALSFLPVAIFGTRRALRESLPRFTVSPTTFWGVVVVVSVFVYAYVIADVGVSFSMPSIEDVYGVRSEYQETENDSSVLLSYATPLIANVINPLIIGRGLLSRRRLWLAAGLLGQLFIYSFTGYRSSLLSPIALLAAFLLFRRSTRPAAVVVLVSFTVLTVGMWALDTITATDEFTSLLVRRFLITPGLLTAGYVFVFADIPKAHLAHSFLKGFLHYPYSREPPQLVGELFFGNPATNANANLLADGFANFGFAGMLLECLVLMVVLWFIDDACRGLPVAVAALAFVMPTLSLADSGLFTTLLTHGMGAATLACLLMPRTGWQPERARREYEGS
jgi:oligosaccharide repeat unit polymerase